ncbi:hypothetical protein ACFU8A_42440, partial [Streptomyces sp. NPDC057546]
GRGWGGGAGVFGGGPGGGGGAGGAPCRVARGAPPAPPPTAGWRDRLGEQFVAMYELWTAGQPLPNVVDKQRGYVPVREPGE